MTVEKLLTTITARELTEWRAYDSIQPFGDERADLRAASIRQAVIAVHAKKKSDQPKLADCMLKFEAKKKQTALQIEQILKGFVKAKGGKINDGNS
ncbi:hypothetical protein LCGC14_1021880 [marine sediment metagenome]|uniref:Minor tail T domain-containing protein n=1 Tax=marine sediment metagenome TaxID=412755 RepID=A0A0F9NIS6_9ZZZZ